MDDRTQHNDIPAINLIELKKIINKNEKVLSEVVADKR